LWVRIKESTGNFASIAFNDMRVITGLALDERYILI
jgi:hypothetical protein